MASRIDAFDSIHLDVPASDAFDILRDFAGYETWWPPRLRFAVSTPAVARPGTSFRISNGPLVAWTATVREIVPDRLIRFEYGEGAWEGTAEWIVTKRDDGCDVAYRISIVPALGWLRLLGHFLDLARLHSREMSRVLQALRGVTQERIHSVSAHP
jgi:uncharacterized protein YndB with AHSA1/START domain